MIEVGPASNFIFTISGIFLMVVPKEVVGTLSCCTGILLFTIEIASVGSGLMIVVVTFVSNVL